MCSRFSSLLSAVICVGVAVNAVYGQTYQFDGGADGTSWDEASNWDLFLDEFNIPEVGDAPTPPNSLISANIPMVGVVIDSTMPGQTALDVNVGTANGVGSLSVTGGDLSAADDITVGAGSNGTMTISGGTVSNVDDFNINGESLVTVSGGDVIIGDRLNMLGDAVLIVDGGNILAEDDFFFFENSQITVESGSMVVHDKLRFDDDTSFNGKLTINGGVVRTQEFGFVDDFGVYFERGLVEINGDGVFQSETPNDPGDPESQLSLAHARALIDSGRFITSEISPLRLGVQTVIVPEFNGNQNVMFTQILVVPEPATLALLAFGALGLAIRRRRD